MRIKALVLALFLVIGLVLPSSRSLQESVETNRRMTIVFDTLNNVRRLKDWNPLIPSAANELSYSGGENNTGVGAKVDYNSANAAWGQGSWEIVTSDRPTAPGTPGKIVYSIVDKRMGSDKQATFDLLPTGKDKPVATATSLTDTIDGDAPSKPFGGADEYTWSPDGASVVAAIRVAGKGEAWSTNFDLYQVAADGSSAPVNLTASNPAWDTGPVFSADGKTLFYRAMKRPGFEADRFGLMAMDLATKQVREIAPSWDRSADGIVVSKDGATIYTTAQDVGQHPLFAVDVASGAVHSIEPGTIYILDKHDKHILRAFEEMELACVFNPPLIGREVHNAEGAYALTAEAIA